MKIKQSEINRIDKESLNERMLSIATDVANAVLPTYGPYGACTLVQSVDSVYSTKDGWTVLQNLTYGYNGVNNALKKLIQDCAQSVLLKVGDGTTTVTLLAQQIYKRVYTSILSGETHYNAKELEVTLKRVVTDICERMMSSCNVITDDNMEETIRSIASCSTNWDEEMAGYIVDIYKNTKNPIIKFENSGTENSYVKYTSGYDIKGELMLPNQYLTNRETGECVVEKPAVLMFDYALKKEMLGTITFIADMYAMSSEHTTLVIIAPDFQPDFINGLMSMNMGRIRAGQSYVSCIPFKYYTHGKIDKDCAEDLCILLGTDMISQENTNIVEVFSDVESAITMRTRAMKDKTVSEEDKQKYVDEERMTIVAAYNYLKTISGTCAKIIATEKYILAEGLSNSNERLINERKEKLVHEIDLETKEAAALSMITNKVRFKRIRLGKLQCNMGTIYVGGFGDANLKSKRDALDDATKACEAAYNDGVIVGGGVAALRAIMEIDYTVHADNDGTNHALYEKLINIIKESYISVISMMYYNKYGDTDSPIDIKETIIKSAKTGVGYNLIAEKFDEYLITPVRGEVEILKGCMSLVSVMICSNQLVFHDINSIEDADRVRAIEEAGDISVETAANLAKRAAK